MKRFARRGAALLLALLGALAILRVADGYRVFSVTFDEVAHIGTGMQWLDTGRYEYEPQHPPMRAVYAIGPRLLGVHAFREADMWSEGRRILYDGGNYRRILTAARSAALPFFLLTLVVVGVWAARIGGSVAALAAVFSYSMLPLALAHAGLATTDTPVTATLALAFFAWALFLESPSAGRASVFGAAAGLAVLSKFSSLLFLGLTVLVSGAIGALRKAGPEPRAPRWALARALWAVPIAFLVLWAGYRFSFGPPVDSTHPPYGAPDRLLGVAGVLPDLAHRLLRTSVPMPEFVRGLQDVLDHNARGHGSFFMGEMVTRGHWSFFPVGILVKTPIAFLVLALAGLIVIARMARRAAPPTTWLPGLAALLILLSCLPSAINIGMRHVLPMFPLLAVSAGVGFATLWRSPVGARRLGPALGLLMLGWLGASSLRAHPDYLAYFNECCQREPQRWLVDSDLDWGQDLDRLAAALERRGVDEVYLAYFGMADPARHGMPRIRALEPDTPVHGWVAASEYRLATNRYRWLDAYAPTERIGRSIRLYRIP